MPGNKLLKDQRNNPRFQVGNNVYALLKQSQYRELGKVIDISKTGISFLCINEGNWADNSFTIDIMSSEDQQDPEQFAVLKNLPLQPIVYCRDGVCTAIFDKENNSLNHSLTRFGVAFDKLNNEQRSMLDLFILRHAVARA